MPTLINAEPVEVELLDGRKETLAMKRLSIRELYTFAEHVRTHRTPHLVALCFSQPVEWVDQLADASFAALTDKCVALNFQRAMTIAEKDPVMAMLIGPIVATGVLSVAQMLQTNPAGPSTNASSPAPVPSASAAETGSASST